MHKDVLRPWHKWSLFDTSLCPWILMICCVLSWQKCLILPLLTEFDTVSQSTDPLMISVSDIPVGAEWGSRLWACIPAWCRWCDDRFPYKTTGFPWETSWIQAWSVNPAHTYKLPSYSGMSNFIVTLRVLCIFIITLQWLRCVLGSSCFSEFIKSYSTNVTSSSHLVTVNAVINTPTPVI